VSTDERQAWDRRHDETARAYDAFRRFRELGAARNLGAIAKSAGVALRTVQRWSEDHLWFERAVAWDDEVHMLDDRRRLDALRTMHDTHQKAGRALQHKALAALAALDPDQIPAYAAARLMELGARLERETLTVSVEELQGAAKSGDAVSDPWEAIARELTGGD
jgi:hypothetical protein